MFVLYITLKNVFYPAYLSYIVACNPVQYELINEQLQTQGYEISIAGSVTYNESLGLIIKYSDEKVLKHELIHVNQLIRGWPSLSCNYPLQKYLSEVEAYTGENFPDFIYDRIYVREF